MSDELQTAQGQEVGEDFQPAEEMVVSNLESLKVMADTNRLRILEALSDKPLTVKQVARQLGISPTKLYYHINLLEEHGFVVVTSSRIVSGIIEKQYRAATYSLKIDRSLLSFSSAQASENIDSLMSVAFEATRQDFRTGLRTGLIKLDNEDPMENNAIIGRTLSRMTPGEYKTFREKFVALVKEFGATMAHNDDSRPAYGLTIALYPLAEDDPDDPGEDEEPTSGGRWKLD